MIEKFAIIKQHNYWDKRPVNTGFIRKTYLDLLIQSLGNRLIKVLTGQRRVGKSYIMRQFINELLDKEIKPENIFYLNKELVAFDYITHYRHLKQLIAIYEKNVKPEGKKYIILDEVQEIDGWEKIVNSLSQDPNNEYEVFITGSNSKMLSGELATLLSGRYISFEIFPFSYTEFINYKKLPLGKNSYIQYLKEGGLPELFHINNEELKLNYLTSLKDTILLKDIVKRHNVKDVFMLERLFKFLVSNIGSMFSVNNITNYFITNKIRINYETLASYLDYFQESYLIHRADRFEIKTKEILSGTKKFYINDLSYRNYLVPAFEFEFGHLLENSVFLYYKAQGYSIYVGFGRNYEIDFVLQKGNNKKYVQISYLLSDKNVIDREFGNLARIKDNYEKIVVSLDDVSFGNYEGIQHICAWDLK
ncbi:MAG: ATP-binding protein [Bacteroidia bacterium]|nr:ATP-binding protein [Bacteroidia bacterium]